MSNLPEHTGQGRALLHKRFGPAPVEPDQRPQQQKANIGLLKRIWYTVLGYALNDAHRLHEAGIRKFEGKASEQHYQNKKIDAEAMKIYADAEVLKQKAAKEQMELFSKQLELEEKRLDLEERRIALQEREAEAALRQTEAWERFRKAIEIIRIKDGDVLANSKQLEQTLKLVGQLPEAREEPSSESEEDAV